MGADRPSSILGAPTKILFRQLLDVFCDEIGRRVRRKSRRFRTGVIPEDLRKRTFALRHEIAMIIVDHHLDLALALSDRTVVLERGAVSWAGASQMLKDDLALRRKMLWM